MRDLKKNKMGIDYCYHTHTKRCGHASGLDEEYVIAAINQGIKVLGFSDHIFLKGIVLEHNRGTIDELDDYVNSINSLKEKYKDQIEIHVGFEAEYLPQYLDYYKQLLESKKIEYLILGQHCKVKDNQLVFYGLLEDHTKGALEYTRDLIKGIKTGLFKYLCHPDFFVYWVDKDSELFKKCSLRMIRAAEKYNVPIEINLGGIRNPYLDEKHKYASEQFFSLIGKRKVKVIIGVDAHNPSDFAVSNYKYAKYLINKYNLEEITRLDFDK